MGGWNKNISFSSLAVHIQWRRSVQCAHFLYFQYQQEVLQSCLPTALIQSFVFFTQCLPPSAFVILNLLITVHTVNWNSFGYRNIRHAQILLKNWKSQLKKKAANSDKESKHKGAVRWYSANKNDQLLICLTEYREKYYFKKNKLSEQCICFKVSLVLFSRKK